MKRVLVITYHFPPQPTVGSLRLAGLAKYLPRFGWEPVIVTPRFPGREGWAVPVVETDYRDVLGEFKQRLGLQGERGLQEQLGVNTLDKSGASKVLSKLTTLAKAIWCYPDEQRGWFRYAVEAALDASRRFECSAIVSSSNPVTAHLVGKAVKEGTGLPWVADLRDLWTDNHNYRFPRVRRLLERRLEIKTFGVSDALVTVSEPLAQVLQRRHKTVPVYSIPNGYDPDDVAPSPKLTEDFSITYTGSLYDGKRDPCLLFQSLADLTSRGAIDRTRVRVTFYGPDVHKVLLCAQSYGVEDMVTTHTPVPREEALRLQRQSQVLLLLDWADPSETGIYTAKLFEYLAAGRPILATGEPQGVVAELLRRTGAGVYARDAQAVGAVLKAWWEQYVALGRVAYEGIQSEVEQYSQVRMAYQFSEVLDRLE